MLLGRFLWGPWSPWATSAALPSRIRRERGTSPQGNLHRNLPCLPSEPIVKSGSRLRGPSRLQTAMHVLTTTTALSPQLKARCEELKLDWSTLSLENLLKEKQALKSQISEKQRHCLELQVGSRNRGISLSEL